jgi:anthranilate phosphoribosyltransferase
MAEVLNALGSKRVWVVHGSDGLDEITTTGETYVASLENGTIKRFSISPEDAGISRATATSLKGGDAETNAEALRAVLRGEKNAYRDIVVLNAAAALIVAGKATTLREGAELAARAIDSGAAAETLSQLVQASNA